MLFNAKQLRNAIFNLKGFAKNTYHQGRKWAQTIDSYAQLFSRGFNASIPLLNEIGAGKAVSHGRRAIENFDTVRQNVVDLDARGSEHLSRIESAIS